jgi:hypothetical protein
VAHTAAAWAAAKWTTKMSKFGEALPGPPNSPITGGAGSLQPRFAFSCCLTLLAISARVLLPFSGGALVSTWEMRQRRHAEDDPLASLITRIKH